MILGPVLVDEKNREEAIPGRRIRSGEFSALLSLAIEPAEIYFLLFFSGSLISKIR